jgi:hypothetical protein
MSYKKIKWMFIIFVSVTLMGFILWPTLKKIREGQLQFGQSFNHVRDSLGVPIIENNFVLYESNPYYRFWAIPDTTGTVKGPIHQSKSSGFYNDEIVDEEDEFFYEVTDSLAYRLFLRYDFKKSVWECEFVNIKKFRRGPAEYWPLSIAEADSVLTKWGLRRYGLQHE